jgi:hypothetical protein
MEGFSASLDNFVNDLGIKSNPYVTAIIAVFAIAYAGIVAPKLPEPIANLMDYTIVRIIILFLIAYMANTNPTAALMIAIAFLVSMNTLTNLDRDKKGVAEAPTYLLNETGNVFTNIFNQITEPIRGLF